MNGTSKDSNSYREQVAGVNLQSQILKILQELLSESLQELWASMKSRITPLYVNQSDRPGRMPAVIWVVPREQASSRPLFLGSGGFF